MVKIQIAHMSMENWHANVKKDMKEIPSQEGYIIFNYNFFVDLILPRFCYKWFGGIRARILKYEELN